MKRLSFIVFLFSAMLVADTTNVSGNVSGSWTISNSPYIVTNNLVLQPSDTLTINPGVEIRFDGNYRFDIFGTFLAVGTEADSITFTRNGSTNWMSLNFADDADDNSQMQYCIVEYAGSSASSGHSYVIKGLLCFNQCTLRYNDVGGNGGVIDGSRYVGGSYLKGVFTNNTIHNNPNAVAINYASNATITGNTIYNNLKYDEHKFASPMNLRLGIFLAYS